MCSTDIFLGLLAVLFPPLAVWVKRGLCSADSLINILLSTLGYLPGLFHAWYIIAKYPEPDYEYQGLHDAEGGHGRVYVFVHSDGRQQRVPVPQHAHFYHKPGAPQANMNYGTNHSAAASSSSTPAHPAPQQHQQHQHQHEPQDAGVGPSDGGAPPPSYAQVVAGDHKIQTHE